MTKTITITWSIEDLRTIRGDLTDQQLCDTLQNAAENHDPCVGINWDVLKSAAYDLYGVPKTGKKLISLLRQKSHNYHCAECNEFVYCDDVRAKEGKVKDNGDPMCGDGDWICSNCAEYTECADCKLLYLSDEIKYDGYKKALCVGCFNEEYFICTDCNTFFHYETNAARLGDKGKEGKIICGHCLGRISTT